MHVDRQTYQNATRYSYLDRLVHGHESGCPYRDKGCTLTSTGQHIDAPFTVEKVPSGPHEQQGRPPQTDT